MNKNLVEKYTVSQQLILLLTKTIGLFCLMLVLNGCGGSDSTCSKSTVDSTCTKQEKEIHYSCCGAKIGGYKRDSTKTQCKQDDNVAFSSDSIKSCEKKSSKACATDCKKPCCAEKKACKSTCNKACCKGEKKMS